MSMGRDPALAGSAAEGSYMVPPAVWAQLQEQVPNPTPAAPPMFMVETEEGLRSREEQRFFDWSIGILQDAGVVGVLKNDYVYQATTLHGEVQPERGLPYRLSLSRTSIDVDYGVGTGGPIRFTDAVVETDGEVIEAGQIRRALDHARQQSALQRAWRDCTPMRSSGSVIFSDLRLSLQDWGLAMDVCMDLAEFTLNIRRTSKPGFFGDSLTSAETPIVQSPRAADALLSDAAEEAGGVPEPAVILYAMITAADAARRNPEWLGASCPRSSPSA